MACLLVFALFLFPTVVLFSSANQDMSNSPCKHINCGKAGPIRFPFFNNSHTSCGMYQVNCSDDENLRIQFKEGGYFYKFDTITQDNQVRIKDEALNKPLLDRMNKSCELIEKYSFPNITSVLSNVSIQPQNSSLLNCSRNPDVKSPSDSPLLRCRNYEIYDNDLTLGVRENCSVIQLPIFDHFIVEVHFSQSCGVCYYQENGLCLINSEHKFTCSRRKDHGKLQKLGLGIGLSLGLLIFSVIGFFLYRRYKQRHNASNTITRNQSDLYINSDPEAGSICYDVPVFSYKDLQEATNNFDPEKVLGDGGFGTVYFGVLKDGREVAVKRLYEHNYRRLEQFMNEVEILTLLRHKNLVSLFGCSSRRSKELLLVYEYIPNGTVADHLHGEIAQTSPLTWPIRINIAIETANALFYLHSSKTIHRDVKTSNILLDNNFSVKVADFGLSKLFPLDVTHVSTAPQGTPGYVDPEYHQCYQLTSKSDVYSFGVVLIELISSMPAVDITRHRHEINLSNLAKSKIEKNAYHELVDPSLGFESDCEVKRMVIGVAKLAFRCLEQDKEMRPTMMEVLEELKMIKSGGESEDSVRTPTSPECDEVGLLKSTKEEPLSPNTVTQIWHSSRSTTPNISG